MAGLSISAKLRKRILLCIPVLLVCACLLYLFFAPIREGVSAGGLDLSGLTVPQAGNVLTAALEETLLGQELPVELPKETIALSPENCKVRINTAKLLLDALLLDPEDAPAGTDLSLQPYLSVDEQQIRTLLSDYAAKYDTELTQASWKLEGSFPELSTDAFDADAPCPVLALTMGLPDQHLDVDGLYSCILNTYPEAIRLCREKKYRVSPEIQPEAIPGVPDAAAICREFAVEPVNDSLNRETFAFIPGSYGLSLDQKALEKAIRSADYGQRIVLPMEYVPPEVMGEDTYYQDVLGAFETKHNTNENRNNNLRLLCKALDGFVLQPGEEFSFNETVGERTKERGYLPAPAYSGNRLTNDYGGGVCQGSTTLYNCVLLADLEVTCRLCHGAQITYVPYGLDATVNYLTTDFCFRNNWNFPIKLQAEVSEGYVRMKILGTDEKDYYVKMEATSGEDDIAIYARSWKCKYDKETDEQISRESEAFSTYYKNIG